MKQITIRTGKVEMLVVDLPEIASRIKFFDDIDRPYLSYFLSYFEGIKTIRFYMPIGFKHLGKATELTEEDWKGIVKYVGLPWCAYVDYITNKNWFSAATESGISLLKANGVEVTGRTHVFIKHTVYEKD